MVTHTQNLCSAFTHPKGTHTAVNTHTLWTRAGLVIWHTGHFPGGPTHYRAGTCSSWIYIYIYIYIYSLKCWWAAWTKKLPGPIFLSQSSPAVNTHPEQWAAFYAAVPREQLGVCGIEGRESIVHSLPQQFLPARDSNSQPFDCESNSLTITPRLQNFYYEVNYPFRQNSQFQYCQWLPGSCYGVASTLLYVC